MASWSDLLLEYEQNVQKDPHWLVRKLQEQLSKISELRKHSTVIFYASSFLQRPGIDTSILHAT